MASKKSIQDEIDKTNRSNQGKYDYVDVGMLERLGISAFKVTDNDNFLRIISPLKAKFYGREIFIHSKIGADGVTILCLDKMYGEKCPVCEYRKQLQEEKASEAMLSVLAWRKRYLFFVIDVTNDSTMDKGLQWYDAPGVVKDNIVSLSKDRRSGEIIDVSDPDDGRDIEFVKTGVKLQTRYSAFKLVNTEPIPKSWFEDVPEFEEILAKPDYDKVKEMVSGTATEESADAKAEVDDTSRSRSRSRDRTPEATDTSRSRDVTTDGVSEEKKEEEKAEVDDTSRSRSRSRDRTPDSEKGDGAADSSDVRAKLDEIQKRHRQT